MMEDGSLVDKGPSELALWLTQKGLAGVGRQDLLNDYCQRLVEMGVPLLRLQISQSAKHPRYGGIGFEWVRGGQVIDQMFPQREQPINEWLQSPLYHLLKTGEDELRVDPRDPDVQARFPFFKQLEPLGPTDYLARSELFETLAPGQVLDPNRPPNGMLISWTSDAPDGFSEADLAVLRETFPYLALAVKSASTDRMASDLLGVYLGQEPAQRVMSGAILRGSLERIHSAILLFDIKGFTHITETETPEHVIALLNDYFGVVEPVISAHGGHVLKFMGDGLLAILDCGDDAADARAALDVVHALNREVGQVSQQRSDANLTVAGFTLALHQGEVLYGNIGAEDRLDFTVIGSAVNMTARLSGMHRALEQDVIVSEAIVASAGAGRNDLVALGRYMIRGIPKPQELFTIYDA